MNEFNIKNGLNVHGITTIVGNIYATNLSGINTGDQELSGYALQTFVTNSISSHNLTGTSHQDIRSSIPSIVGLASETFVTLAVSSHNIAEDSHQDIRALISSPSSLSGYAQLSGATFTGNITALNLSGTNTGDQNLSNLATYTSVTSSISAHNAVGDSHQDIRSLIGSPGSLSGYATLSGATFTGNITALNLSGINTGDQELSGYAEKTFVTLAISSHNLTGDSHQDIRSAIPSIVGLASETFVTNSVTAHNASGSAHTDIRNAIPSIVGLAALSGATFTGNITASNLSGINTGDQNLAPYALQTFVTNSVTAHNASGTAHSDIRGLIPSLVGVAYLSGAIFTGNITALNLSGTNTGDQNLAPYALNTTVTNLSNSLSAYSTNAYTTSSISDHNSSGTAHTDIRNSVTNVSNSLSAYATQSYVTSAIAAIPSVDLSPYATLSGATFIGNITALNLSGTNTGDQDLAPYALSVNVTSEISAHNTSGTAHQDIRNLIPSIAGLATETFATNTVTAHNVNSSAHQDIRNAIPSIVGLATESFATASVTAHNIAGDAHTDIRNAIPSIVGLATETFATNAVTAHNASGTAHSDIRGLIPSIVGLATLSGAIFTGNISATNLSGINTGDQELSGYAQLSGADFTGNVTSPSLSTTSLTSTNISGNTARFERADGSTSTSFNQTPVYAIETAGHIKTQNNIEALNGDLIFRKTLSGDLINVPEIVSPSTQLIIMRDGLYVIPNTTTGGTTVPISLYSTDLTVGVSQTLDIVGKIYSFTDDTAVGTKLRSTMPTEINSSLYVDGQTRVNALSATSIVNTNSISTSSITIGTPTVNLQITQTNNLTGSNYPILIPTDNYGFADQVILGGGVVGAPLTANTSTFLGLFNNTNLDQGYYWGFNNASSEGLIMQPKTGFTKPFIANINMVSCFEDIYLSNSVSQYITDLTTTACPSAGNIRFSGAADRSIIMGNVNNTKIGGFTLSMQAGGAPLAGTDKAGGALRLKAGEANGTGTSSIEFYTAPAGTTGTTRNIPTLKWTIDGAGILSGNSIIHSGIRNKVSIKTSEYTLTSTDDTIVCNSSTPFTVILPAATATGQTYNIKNVNTAVITLSGNAAETIDGSNTCSINQWDNISVIDYDTGKWAII